jgi:hypothetical protein
MGTSAVRQHAYVRVQGLSSDAVCAVRLWAYWWWGHVAVVALPILLLKGLLYKFQLWGARCAVWAEGRRQQ